MKRIAKTVYRDDDDRDLLSISNGKAYLERAYAGYDADTLIELSDVCRAAAEELRATLVERQAVEVN